MFIALYRWKLREGQEGRFQQGWHRLTVEIYEKRGSLGSRLHRAEDGTWVAYAQWPDRQAWEAGRAQQVQDTEALQLMRESIEVSHPPTFMEIVDDLLAHEKKGAAPPTEPGHV
ncbi:MAG TPA: antibiotic biosynthesis monooxygenase [Pyrinomonadaceae bacterium]|nr:antibiotic biosynthesis monooxygenase [Pyrinomonadaceae bacterium]